VQDSCELGWVLESFAALHQSQTLGGEQLLPLDGGNNPKGSSPATAFGPHSVQVGRWDGVRHVRAGLAPIHLLT
jgi:hypothetical protein